MSKETVHQESVKNQIYRIRGHQVMLSSDLARLYGVLPKVLIQAVKRNHYRFPADFMFQLNKDEFNNLKSQTVTSSWGGLRRAFPYAFTEQGVAMLSSVLKSKRAVEVNIQIMRTFVQLKRALLVHRELGQKLDALEKEVKQHSQEIRAIFEAIKRLMIVPNPEPPKRRIGFHSRRMTEV